jgi:hypothetical protein
MFPAANVVRVGAYSGSTNISKKSYKGGLLCKPCADRRNIISLIGVIVLMMVAIPIAVSILLPGEKSGNRTVQPAPYIR